MQGTLLSCRDWCPNCYLDMLDNLSKRICRTVGHKRATPLEPLALRRNLANRIRFCRYNVDNCASKMAEPVPLTFSVSGPLFILIGCMIFLSPFLDVLRMSLATVLFACS